MRKHRSATGALLLVGYVLLADFVQIWASCSAVVSEASKPGCIPERADCLKQVFIDRDVNAVRISEAQRDLCTSSPANCELAAAGRLRGGARQLRQAEVTGGAQRPLLSTQDDKIIDGNGNEVHLHGVAWFGFNNELTMAGLGPRRQGGGDSITQDFKTVVYRIKALGFNSVRLAFSFFYLFDEKVKPVQYKKRCRVAPQEALLKTLTPPRLLRGPEAHQVHLAAAEALPPPPPVNASTCNQDMPQASIFERFVWTVKYMASQGLYVSIDFHSNRGGDHSLWYKKFWVQSWVKLVTALVKEPEVRGKLLLDLINEPDGYGLRWETGALPSLTEYYVDAIDALHPICPDCLFLVEGGGQYMFRANWGDGFNTDENIIRKHNISDANLFFQAIHTKPWLSQVVLAPHSYCPAVSRAADSYEGHFLYKRLSASFGHLAKKGYCAGDVCHRFPVVMGEFGSNFANEEEHKCWRSLVAYMNNEGEAMDGRHTAITSWFYWAWNHDSDDTGGLVKANWRDIEWGKIDALAGVNEDFPAGLGLRPWYMAAASGADTGAGLEAR